MPIRKNVLKYCDTHNYNSFIKLLRQADYLGFIGGADWATRSVLANPIISLIALLAIEEHQT